MLSFLPEMPPASGVLAPSGGPVPPVAGTAGGADFAGLLDAALPRGGTTAGDAPGEAALPLPGLVPSGKSLPPPGTVLPPLAPELALAFDPVEAAPPTAAAPAAPLRERGGTLAAAPRAAVPLAEVQGNAQSEAQSDALPPSPAPVADGAGEDIAQPQPAAEPAEDQPPLPPAIAAAPLVAVTRPSTRTTAPPPGEDTIAPTDEPAPSAAMLVLASAPIAPTLTPPPRAEAMPLVRGGIAPLPARVMLPVSGPASDPASPLSGADSAAPAPTASPAEALPEAPVQPAQSSAPPAAAPQLAAASAPASQPALTPTEAASPLAPTIEDTIAQADTLREALRAARPEMTLRHAEFGAVSLRLEATGTESWRAVLAARDPGFVPAIQAALAERAVTAASAADTAGNSLSQNGTSDQRYGSSPNGGQGGHSPHLSQSGTGDGEAAPDHRRPSTAATLAGRDQQESEGPGSSPARQSRGLFA